MYELYAAGRRPCSSAQRAIVDSAWSLDTGSQRSRALPRAMHAGARSLRRLVATLLSSQSQMTCATVCRP